MKRPIEKDFVDKYGAVGQPQWTFSNQKYQDALNEYIDLIENKVKNNVVLDNVSGLFSAKDMENFAAKSMILGCEGKTTKQLLKEFCDNDR